MKVISEEMFIFLHSCCTVFHTFTSMIYQFQVKIKIRNCKKQCGNLFKMAHLLLCYWICICIFFSCYFIRQQLWVHAHPVIMACFVLWQTLPIFWILQENILWEGKLKKNKFFCAPMESSIDTKSTKLQLSNTRAHDLAVCSRLWSFKIWLQKSR